MPSSGHVPDHSIRARFSAAMSSMYQQEVPLYERLLTIVGKTNEQALANDAAMAEELACHGELARLGCEYHGAIRLGKASELHTMRRLFAVMGMFPVGYYDLSVAGIPVHSTAFRPIDYDSLNRNPFRVFTSLLRIELIEDANLRAEIEAILAPREIFTPQTLELIERFERDGGLDDEDAVRFVDCAAETFRWQSESLVDAEVYERLHDAHRLVADIVSFKGPHINHLTPRTLDIDSVQAAMLADGIDAKEIVEGPPRRNVPILLRQTSFKALEESIGFAGGGATRIGTHTARFGEIEQRGMALTAKGQALYDQLLRQVRNPSANDRSTYEERLERAFRDFPDNLEQIRSERLGHFHFRLVDASKAGAISAKEIEALITAGAVEAYPITYEDFLPVSAAGIFQSNLGDSGRAAYSAEGSRSEFEDALGAKVIDLFDWYAQVERESLLAIEPALSSTVTASRS